VIWKINEIIEWICLFACVVTFNIWYRYITYWALPIWCRDFAVVTLGNRVNHCHVCNISSYLLVFV